MGKNKSIIIGISAAIGLLIVYFGIVSLANSFSHALEQLGQMWYWIALLVAGFGIQIGLYTYTRINLLGAVKGTKAEVAATGTISTGSMIACCAHHIADVLPILGLSAAALFLVRYQVSFILLGIFSNLVGITIMLSIIQKYKLYSENSIFKNMFRFNMIRARNIAGILAVMIVGLSFFLSSSRATDSALSANNIVKADKEEMSSITQPVVKPSDEIIRAEELVKIELPAKVNSENFVSIKVKPEDFSFDQSVKFSVSMNTHQGALDFDLTKISVLEDDEGNIYKPLSWEGSLPGGHHRNGILTFPKIEKKSQFIRLTIKNVYDVSERAFIWDLS